MFKIIIFILIIMIISQDNVDNYVDRSERGIVCLLKINQRVVEFPRENPVRNRIGADFCHKSDEVVVEVFSREKEAASGGGSIGIGIFHGKIERL